MNRIRKISVLLALIGFLLGTLLVGWFGFGRVLDAMLSVSFAGFALLCGWQMVLFAINGAAWDVTMPGLGWRRMGIMIWGRMVRDSAGNCLPFSQLGGFIAGIRAVTTLGISPNAATASTVVDLTAEFLAQILFAAQGMLILLAHGNRFPLVVPMTIALTIALGTCTVFIWMQRRRISPLAGLSRRIVGNRFSGAQDRIDALQVQLTEIYKTPKSVILSFAMHWLGWIGTGIGGWIAFRLLGASITLLDALAIEGLLHAVLATAFLVPGYAGIQEAAYAGIGSLFGLPPEIAIAVSLLRRSRDVAVGIPILIAWQLMEMRRLQLKPL